MTMTTGRKLTFYPAPEPNGTGVLVLPGGGYGNISWDNEGPPPASWLNERGFDAWILRYTVDSHHGATAPVYPAPIDEAVEAVGQIRASGRETPSSIVDFAILTYPVITMHPEAMHEGSLRNLLGYDAAEEVRLGMCAETRVGAHTPARLPVPHGQRPHRARGEYTADEQRSWTGELERWIVGFVDVKA
ncbi:endo-1-4-beta-xylanase B [Apiospora arundinis]